MRTKHRPLTAVATIVCGAVAVATLTTAPATAATKKPDLAAKSARVDKSTVTEGDTLRVTHTIQNHGKAPAKATTTRFYLTTDVTRSLAERRASRTNPRSSVSDILLEGSARTAALKPRRTSTSVTTRVVVPVGTPAGPYRVLVCADDTGIVREADEGDNCTPAGGAVTIGEAAGSDDLTLQTFSDAYRWPDDETSNLSYVKAFCQSAYPAKSYTLAGALASVRNHLEELAPAGLAKVERSGLVDNDTEAQQLAAGALTGGSPGLAMAALLKAHELEPGNGRHLLNAAAVATSISLPNEALAFLDAAVGRTFLRPAFGIPHQATAMVVRGNALIMLGKYAAAQPLFSQAKQMAPILTEPDVGLATIAACKGQDALAARYLRRSRIISDEPVPTTPPIEDPERPDPEIDITRGKPMALRQLPLPATTAQGVAYDPLYDDIQGGFSGEIDAWNQESNQLEQHLRETDELRTPAEIDRRDSILVLLYRSHLEGDVEAAQEAYDEQVDRLIEIREGFFGGGTGEAPYTYDILAEDAWDTCANSDDPDCWIKEMNRTCRPKLNLDHSSYVEGLSRLQNLGDTLLTVWSKRMSGLAANLIDEEAHRLALIQIEQIEMGIYAGIVQQAGAWTHYEKLYNDECVEPLDVETSDAPDSEGADSPGKCDGALKAMNLRAALGPTTVKVNCERIEQGFSAEVLPLLHVFVDVKFDFRSGHVSVWAGAKGGGTAGGVEAGFKSGWYVKVDQQGDLVDTGWRVGPSVSAGAGAAEFGVDDEFDMSITNSTTPGY